MNAASITDSASEGTIFNIDLNGNLLNSFELLAEQKRIPVSEVIKRALATYAYLATETSDGTLKVSITDSNDKILADIGIP